MGGFLRLVELAEVLIDVDRSGEKLGDGPIPTARIGRIVRSNRSSESRELRYSRSARRLLRRRPDAQARRAPAATGLHWCGRDDVALVPVVEWQGDGDSHVPRAAAGQMGGSVVLIRERVVKEENVVEPVGLGEAISASARLTPRRVAARSGRSRIAIRISSSSGGGGGDSTRNRPRISESDTRLGGMFKRRASDSRALVEGIGSVGQGGEGLLKFATVSRCGSSLAFAPGRPSCLASTSSWTATRAER